MTSNATRAETLLRALRASIEGDRTAMGDVFTEDVTAWTPALSARSRDELATEFERRDEAFSDIDVDVLPLDVGGDFACAEWSVTLTHSGPLTLAGELIEPTGLRVTIHGATVAEFRGERICSLRQYWDELAVLDQMGLLPERQP